MTETEFARLHATVVAQAAYIHALEERLAKCIFGGAQLHKHPVFSPTDAWCVGDGHPDPENPE